MGEANMKIWKSLGLVPQTIIIFLATALAMTIYEFLKELAFKGTLNPWESHSITVIVTAIIATVASLIMRKRTFSLEDELRIAAVTFESREGMMVTDSHSVILRVNHAFTEITGYTSEEAVGKTLRLLHSGRHDADFYAEISKSLLRTGSWEGEIYSRRKNGEVYPERLSITAVKSEAQAGTHYVTRMTDLTQRKQADAKIAEQLDELRCCNAINKERETRILEVQHEVNELLREAGQPPRYRSE